MRRIRRDTVCCQPTGASVRVSYAQRLVKLLCGIGAFLSAALLCLFLSGSTPLSAYADEAEPQNQEALETLEEVFADALDNAQAGDQTADMASSLPDFSADVSAADASGSTKKAEDKKGLQKASPYASPLRDISWALLGIIVVASVVLLLLTGRLNKNIDKMRRFVD